MVRARESSLREEERGDDVARRKQNIRLLYARGRL